MLAAVTVGYALIAGATVLSGSRDVLAWIGIGSSAGFVASWPAVLLTRIHFQRRLRSADVALAERMGIFGGWEWDATRRFTATEAFIASS